MKKKTVFIIEDEESWLKLWKEEISQEKVEIKEASNLIDAEDMLFGKKRDNFDAVVMDGWIGGQNTLSVISRIREELGYTGPILAASSSPDFRITMIRHGCDHEAPKEKIPEKLAEVLML